MATITLPDISTKCQGRGNNNSSTNNNKSVTQKKPPKLIGATCGNRDARSTAVATVSPTLSTRRQNVAGYSTISKSHAQSSGGGRSPSLTRKSPLAARYGAASPALLHATSDVAPEIIPASVVAPQPKRPQPANRSLPPLASSLGNEGLTAGASNWTWNDPASDSSAVPVSRRQGLLDVLRRRAHPVKSVAVTENKGSRPSEFCSVVQPMSNSYAAQAGTVSGASSRQLMPLHDAHRPSVQLSFQTHADQPRPSICRGLGITSNIQREMQGTTRKAVPIGTKLRLQEKPKGSRPKWRRMRLRRRPVVECQLFEAATAGADGAEDDLLRQAVAAYEEEIQVHRRECEEDPDDIATAHDEQSDSDDADDEEGGADFVKMALDRLLAAMMADQTGGETGHTHAADLLDNLRATHLRQLLMLNTASLPEGWCEWVMAFPRGQEVLDLLNSSEDDEIARRLVKASHTARDQLRGCPRCTQEACSERRQAATTAFLDLKGRTSAEGRTSQDNVSNDQNDHDVWRTLKDSCLRFLFSVVTKRRCTVFSAAYHLLCRSCESGALTREALGSVLEADDTMIERVFSAFGVLDKNNISLEEFVVVSSLREHLDLLRQTSVAASDANHASTVQRRRACDLTEQLASLSHCMTKFKALFKGLAKSKGAIVRTPEISSATVESMLLSLMGVNAFRDHNLLTLIMATIDTERRGGVGVLDFLQFLPFFASMHELLVGFCCPVHLYTV